MSTFSVPVCRIESVKDHVGADRLSIVKLEGLGYTCITNKTESGEPRYSVSDLCVYVPSAAVLPEWLLKQMDFWNPETGKGRLSGPDGNRVSPMKIRGIYSEGILYPVDFLQGSDITETADAYTISVENLLSEDTDYVEDVEVYVGQDVAEIMGITKYEPPIPTAMSGEVAHVSEAMINYDFERWESVPDIFAEGELVTAVEKAHGTFCSIKLIPDLKHPEMFGETGCITVGSKGISKRGLVFKNNDTNNSNVYVQTLRKLLADDFEKSLATAMSMMYGVTWCDTDNDKKDVTILGEVFGGPIQDLKYGMTTPVFRVFDVKIGNEWLDRDYAEIFCSRAGLEMLPVLYSGPFDLAAIEKVRDGKTTVGGDHVREGVVVTSSNGEYHPMHGRKICKFISHDYLTRKVKGGEATEFQ